MSIRRRSTRSSRPARPRSGRITAPASSRAPGPIPSSSGGCSRTRPRRPIRSAIVSPVGSHLIAVENTPRDAQHRRLHPVLLLSVGGAGAAAGLVQIGALPLARGDRPERRAGRFRRQPAARDRNPHLGFDRRDAVPRRADAARRHRRLERGAARRARHPRQHGRHRPAETPERGRRHEQHDPRHGRHARLRPGRGRSRTSRSFTRHGKAACSRCSARWAAPGCGRSTAAAPRSKRCRR